MNDTKTLKVVYQANQKEKFLTKILLSDSLIVSLKTSYKNSSTFLCNFDFVNNCSNENSKFKVLHAFFKCTWDSDNKGQEKKI